MKRETMAFGKPQEAISPVSQGSPHSYTGLLIPPKIKFRWTLTFGERYLVIISFPFAPRFSSGVISYSA